MRNNVKFTIEYLYGMAKKAVSSRDINWLASSLAACRRLLVDSHWAAIIHAHSKHILSLSTLHFLTIDALLFYVNNRVGIAQQHN